MSGSLDRNSSASTVRASRRLPGVRCSARRALGACGAPLTLRGLPRAPRRRAGAAAEALRRALTAISPKLSCCSQLGLAAFVELEQREQRDGDGHAVGAADGLVEAEGAAAQQAAQVREALGDRDARRRRCGAR